jgi:hypothetical protein
MSQIPDEPDGNQETRTRGSEIAAMERREAPAFLARGARQDGRLVRHSVLHPLGFARGAKQEDGVSRAAKNREGGALAISPVMPGLDPGIHDETPRIEALRKFAGAAPPHGLPGQARQ